MDQIQNEDELLCVLKKMGFTVYLSTFKKMIKSQPIPLDYLVKEYLKFNSVPGSGGNIRDADRIVYQSQYERVYKIAENALHECENDQKSC
ncbi:MAG: hypothetical protein KRP56_01785 [Candidatus Methanogranum gryphiswaldense]|nr:MAG: hypothetical protein KRP56_01785 [Candidatus Methanogranum sp. U3.2.1]